MSERLNASGKEFEYASMGDPVDVDALADRIAQRLRPSEDRPLYSIRTLAKRLELSERTVRQMLLDGKIKSFTVADGSRRVDPLDVDAYVAGRKANG